MKKNMSISENDIQGEIEGSIKKIYHCIYLQQRNLNDTEGMVLEWAVDGDHMQAVTMLPGYTHNIINLSETENLIVTRCLTARFQTLSLRRFKYSAWHSRSASLSERSLD